MQKVALLFVLFAIVAGSWAHHGHRKPDGPPMPNPPTPPTQEIEDHEIAGNRRVARQAPPEKMPNLAEMKAFAEEQISKLPEPVQDAIHKLQDSIAQKMKDGQS